MTHFCQKSLRYAASVTLNQLRTSTMQLQYAKQSIWLFSKHKKHHILLGGVCLHLWIHWIQSQKIGTGWFVSSRDNTSTECFLTPKSKAFQKLQLSPALQTQPFHQVLNKKDNLQPKQKKNAFQGGNTRRFPPFGPWNRKLQASELLENYSQGFSVLLSAPQRGVTWLPSLLGLWHDVPQLMGSVGGSPK